MTTKKVHWLSNTTDDSSWRATSMRVDSFDSTVGIVLQQGNRVERLTLTMELCQQIGFINFDALNPFAEKLNNTQ